MRNLMFACVSLLLGGSWAVAQIPAGWPPAPPGSLQRLPSGGWQSAPANWQPPPEGTWAPTPPPKQQVRSFFRLRPLPLVPACGSNKTFHDFGANGWKADCRFIFSSSWEFFAEPCPVQQGHRIHGCIEGIGPMRQERPSHVVPVQQSPGHYRGQPRQRQAQPDCDW